MPVGVAEGLGSQSLAWGDHHLPWPPDLHVGITKRLKTVEVLEGQSCTFECVLSHENTGDVATWTVGGKTVGGSGRFRASRQGRKYTLAVQDAAPSDAGEVAFSMRDLTSKASLIVRGGHQGRAGWAPVSTGLGVHGAAGRNGVLLGTVPRALESSPVGDPETPVGVLGV